MNIYALSDLHLSGQTPKPMDIFGENWSNHSERIRKHWLETIEAEDIVLVPGDISWAMSLGDAAVDLNYVASLPGKKVILRGNHDYWWSSATRVAQAAGPNTLVLQNNAYAFGSAVVCGSRGWLCPGSSAFSSADDGKIFERECVRLQLSLEAASRLKTPDHKLIAITHFPPFNERRENNAFMDLFRQYGVSTVLYGHLHGPVFPSAFEGEMNGIDYKLVSCDYLGFTPRLIYKNV